MKVKESKVSQAPKTPPGAQIPKQNGLQALGSTLLDIGDGLKIGRARQQYLRSCPEHAAVDT
jgi:hypothetical protein